MTETRFTEEWVAAQRLEWRSEVLHPADLEIYRVNYSIPGWAVSEYRDALPFGAALAIERLCCEVERLREALTAVSAIAPKRRDGSKPVGWAQKALEALGQ